MKEAEIVAAIEREEKKLKGGIDKLKLAGEEQELAVSFHSFASRHCHTIMDLTSGGLVSAFLKMSAELEHCQQKLRNGANGGGSEVAELVLKEIEMDWRNFFECADAVKNLADMAQRAALVKAKIEQMRNGGGNGKRAKPGFAPLVSVKGDKVEIHEGKA